VPPKVVRGPANDAADGVGTLVLGQLEVETAEAVLDLGACSWAEGWDDHAPFLLEQARTQAIATCDAVAPRSAATALRSVDDHEVALGVSRLSP
jgi:hypothetical protein